MKDFIVKNNIKLIIVDVYRRVISYEENDAGAVSKFFTDEIKPICEETGASFIFIHHHKKGKSENDPKELLRGSSDFVNFIDGVIQISRKGNSLTIEQTKNRSGKEIEPFKLSIETDEENFLKFIYQGNKEQYSASGFACEIISLWIAKQEESIIKTKDIQEVCNINSIKRMAMYGALTELEKRGEIEKLTQGKYKILSKSHLDKLKNEEKKININSDDKTADLEFVHFHHYMGGGKLDKTNSNMSKLSIGQNGQNGQNGKSIQKELGK